MQDYFFFVESALYAVSAREELPAFPGAADGGITPLLAAESIEVAAAETVSAGLLSAPVLLPQDPKPSVKTAKETMNNFFIKMIS